MSWDKLIRLLFNKLLCITNCPRCCSRWFLFCVPSFAETSIKCQPWGERSFPTLAVNRNCPEDLKPNNRILNNARCIHKWKQRDEGDECSSFIEDTFTKHDFPYATNDSDDRTHRAQGRYQICHKVITSYWKRFFAGKAAPSSVIVTNHVDSKGLTLYRMLGTENGDKILVSGLESKYWRSARPEPTPVPFPPTPARIN